MLRYLPAIICVFCIDPDECGYSSMNLGRVSYSNTCDQQRMENLVEKLEDVSTFMNNEEEGDYKDVCDWPGVTCSEDGVSVLKIVWYFKSLKGPINLSWMTATTTIFSVFGNNITGTLDTTTLPRNLKMINLQKNNFSGTVDWEALPSNIEQVNLFSNKLEGNVNLDILPASLNLLYVGLNKFTTVSGKKREGLYMGLSGVFGLRKI